MIELLYSANRIKQGAQHDAFDGIRCALPVLVHVLMNLLLVSIVLSQLLALLSMCLCLQLLLVSELMMCSVFGFEVVEM